MSTEHIITIIIIKERNKVQKEKSTLFFAFLVMHFCWVFFFGL